VKTPPQRAHGAEPQGEVQIFFQGDVTWIRLFGEVDLRMRDSLDGVAAQAVDYGAPVRVDVSNVMFIDSSGLGFLARLAAAGEVKGWAPTVVGANQLVRETIAIGGLLPVLDMVD
jgi:anti-sigma B factor antagonist